MPLDRLPLQTPIARMPAKWLLEWKKRGLISNCRDAIIQAFKVYHEKILDQDLRAAQLKTLVEDGLS